ncbi:MAG: HNH endonuclease [Gammaproteobacteria bacterium]
MTKLFVITADVSAAREAREASIVNPIERGRVLGSFSDASYPELIEIERRGRGFYAWGVPPGSQNVANWMYMSTGDYVLVAFEDAYRFFAKVLGRYESARAATAIWGEPPAGENPREFLFFLSEPIPVSLPLSELQDYLPVRPKPFAKIADGRLDRIEDEFGSLERFVRKCVLNKSVGGPILDVSGLIHVAEQQAAKLKANDPENAKAARRQMFEILIRRRGHPRFRNTLLEAYERRCAITNFDAPDALDAAYIIPYRGKYTDHPSNGLLLRADIHTIFDLGKIAIDTRSMTVVVSDELQDTNYRLLAGRPLRFPQQPRHRPSTDALDVHRKLAGL